MLESFGLPLVNLAMEWADACPPVVNKNPVVDALVQRFSEASLAAQREEAAGRRLGGAGPWGFAGPVRVEVRVLQRALESLTVPTKLRAMPRWSTDEGVLVTAASRAAPVLEGGEATTVLSRLSSVEREERLAATVFFGLADLVRGGIFASSFGPMPEAVGKRHLAKATFEWIIEIVHRLARPNLPMAPSERGAFGRLSDRVFSDAVEIPTIVRTPVLQLLLQLVRPPAQGTSEWKQWQQRDSLHRKLGRLTLPTVLAVTQFSVGDISQTFSVVRELLRGGESFMVSENKSPAEELSNPAAFLVISDALEAMREFAQLVVVKGRQAPEDLTRVVWCSEGAPLSVLADFLGKFGLELGSVESVLVQRATEALAGVLASVHLREGCCPSDAQSSVDRPRLVCSQSFSEDASRALGILVDLVERLLPEGTRTTTNYATLTVAARALVEAAKTRTDLFSRAPALRERVVSALVLVFERATDRMLELVTSSSTSEVDVVAGAPVEEENPSEDLLVDLEDVRINFFSMLLQDFEGAPALDFDARTSSRNLLEIISLLSASPQQTNKIFAAVTRFVDIVLRHAEVIADARTSVMGYSTPKSKEEHAVSFLQEGQVLELFQTLATKHAVAHAGSFLQEGAPVHGGKNLGRNETDKVADTATVLSVKLLNYLRVDEISRRDRRPSRLLDPRHGLRLLAVYARQAAAGVLHSLAPGMWTRREFDESIFDEVSKAFNQACSSFPKEVRCSRQTSMANIRTLLGQVGMLEADGGGPADKDSRVVAEERETRQAIVAAMADFVAGSSVVTTDGPATKSAAVRGSSVVTELQRAKTRTVEGVRSWSHGIGLIITPQEFLG